MRRVEYILDSWISNISGYKKLKLNDAQKLYRKMISFEGKKKDLLREELILGTLYLIPSFIKGSLLPYIKNNSYDMNDIINACNEVWINVIDSGRLLEVSFYSQLFDDNFYNEIVSQFAPVYRLHSETGGSAIFFCKLLSWFINETMDGKEVSYDLFLKYFDELLVEVTSKHVILSLTGNKLNLYILMANISNYLKKNGFTKNKISERQLERLKNLLFDNVFNSMNINIREVKITDCNELYLNNVLEQKIIDIIFNYSCLKQKEKDVIRYRYGLDDGEFKTLEETGRVFNITKSGAGLLESRAFKKIEKDVKPLLEDYFCVEPKIRERKYF